MQCERIEELFVDCLTGGLPDGDEQRVREHLAGCVRCAAEFAELQQTWTVLDAWPDEEPPVLLTDAVRKEILRDLASQRRSRLWGPVRLFSGVALGIALAVLAIAFLPGRSALAEISTALLLSCAAFWAGVFVFASLLLMRPWERGAVNWRGVGLAGLLAMGGSMLLTRSCDVVTLVDLCARSRWCGGAVGLVGVGGGYFVAGALYAAAPLFVTFLLLREEPPIRPVYHGAVAGALLFALLVPAILLQCVPFTLGLVTSWLGGTLFGSLVGGSVGSWMAVRLGRAPA